MHHLRSKVAIIFKVVFGLMDSAILGFLDTHIDIKFSHLFILMTISQSVLKTLDTHQNHTIFNLSANFITKVISTLLGNTTKYISVESKEKFQIWRKTFFSPYSAHSCILRTLERLW